MLRQCLEALVGKINIDHEIVVIDAGSTDGTIDYLEGLPGIRLVSMRVTPSKAQGGLITLHTNGHNKSTHIF